MELQGYVGSFQVSEPYRFSTNTRTSTERQYMCELEMGIKHSSFSGYEKMQNFPMYTPRQDITRYLAKYEIFKHVLDVQGSIVECGCLFGGGLMWWAQLSAIFEPMNHQRRVIGFDTFEGVPSLSHQDEKSVSQEAKIGGLGVCAYDEILGCITLYDANRPMGHISRVSVVRGDARQTIPKFLEENPHFICSLLMLDFDIYEPTETALTYFLPRMPKGAIIAFDELNMKSWPGETLATLESGLLGNLRLRRFPWGPTACYAILGE